MEFRNISIIGLGLIGGSIAKAIKSFSLSHFISGFDKPDILDKALTQKVIDKRLSSFEECLDADLIFICLPVDASINVFEKLSAKINPNQIITDVCGVKSVFQEIWDKQERKGFYIGGHPMTGKEKGGFEFNPPNCLMIMVADLGYLI